VKFVRNGFDGIVAIGSLVLTLSGIMFFFYLEMLCWIFGWLSMVQVVVGAIIHHIPQQATAK
jgi:hypothetical protein